MSYKPGNQYEFFRNVKLSDDGKLLVDVDGLPELINLLNNLVIKVDAIEEDTEEIKNNTTAIQLDTEEIKKSVADVNSKIDALKTTCITLKNNICCPPPPKPACTAEHTLIDGVYVDRAGRVSNVKPRVYNWGGWTIAR